MPAERPGRQRPALLATGAALLALILGLATAAPRLAPADPIRLVDPPSTRHRPPGTRLLEIELIDGSKLLGERIERRREGLLVEDRGQTREVRWDRLAGGAAAEPTVAHSFPLGSDSLGRDLLSRLLFGARISLSIGVLAAAFSLLLGVAVGGLAAIASGPADFALMRLVDAAIAFPRLLLVLVLASLFDSGTTTLIVMLGATSWMGASRIVRAEILTIKERDFVLAARAAGQSPLSILFRHLLPNALGPAIVDTTLRVGDLILVEAALSFIGLGVAPPRPTWGGMIAQGSDFITTAWWESTLPGLAIVLTVVAFNLFGDGLRDYLDPRRGGDKSSEAAC